MRRRSTLGALANRLIPASLYCGETALPLLSRIDQEIGRCRNATEALGVLESSKPELYSGLCRRFDVTVAQAVTLKILNLFLARFHFRARSSSVLSRPFGLVVDPSNMCQLACPGCVHSARSEDFKLFDWPHGTLSQDCFSELLKRYGPYAIGVYFCSYGEPLLNLATPKLIRLAKTYLIGTALSTSLSVRKLDAEACVESGLDFMVLSIDGATQPVYEQYRRNGDIELVFSNVRKLVSAKRKLGKRTPVLSWNFLAFEHNAHEIPQAERMARELGVNRFRVVNPFDVGWDDPNIRPAPVQARVERLDWLSMANSPENWNPFPEDLDRPPIADAFENPWKGEAPDDAPPSAGHTCHWLYKNIVMDAGGRIMPCCGAPRPDTNLVFARFDGKNGDPFNAGKYREARSWFSAGSPALDPASAASAPHCARCEWDHTAVNVGGPEILRYFRAADAAFFDRRSLRILSAW
jgi:MoaA/NifB/PqqE/SkfB family radical SAM enzyme